MNDYSAGRIDDAHLTAHGLQNSIALGSVQHFELLTRCILAYYLELCRLGPDGLARCGDGADRNAADGNATFGDHARHLRTAAHREAQLAGLQLRLADTLAGETADRHHCWTLRPGTLSEYHFLQRWRCHDALRPQRRSSQCGNGIRW